MPYVEILKRAWTLTWRYKILWLFGLLAGTGGGIKFGDIGNGISRRAGSAGGRGRIPGMPEGMGDRMPWRDGGFGPLAMQWLQDNAGMIALVVGIALILGLVLLVLGIAAKGGLVHLSARADSGEAVTAGDGWRVGFRYWWRTFGTHLAIFLPILAIIIAGAMVLGAVGIGAMAAWNAERQGIAGTGAVAFIGLMLLFSPFLFIAIFAANLLLELALRHAILADQPVFDAVGTAWRNLRDRFLDVFLMWLVQLLCTLLFGFVIAVIAGVVLVPAVIAGIAAESVGLGIAFALPGLLLLLIPVAIYAAWRSTAWTVFWRQLVGPSTAP